LDPAVCGFCASVTSRSPTVLDLSPNPYLVVSTLKSNANHRNWLRKLLPNLYSS
jgi:hypothetical protein